MENNHSKTKQMNLGHRIGEGRLGRFDLVVHRLDRPITYFVPMFMFVLSLWTAIPYFGQAWQTSSFSTALLPTFFRLLATIFKTEELMVQSTFILLGYVFAPLSFYFFVFRITRRHLPSIFTALMVMLPTSPFSSQVSERLILAVVSGDGAHILGLTFIPLISMVFLKYQDSGERKHLIIFAFCTAFLAAISFFSIFILTIFMFYLSVSEALIGLGRVKLLRLLIGLAVLGMVVVVVYNRFLLSLILSNEGRVFVAVLFNIFPMAFFLVPILSTFAFLIFDRRKNLQPVFLSLGFSITFGLLHLVRMTFVKIPILEKDRYAAEWSFALAFFISIGVMWLFDFIRAGKLINKYPIALKYRTWIAYGLVISILLFLVGSIAFIPRSI